MRADGRVAREVARNYAYVGVWMSVSTSVILFNKWLLAFSGFPYPITLTMWHMAFCSTVGFLCVRGFKVVKSHNLKARDYLRRVMPIGAPPRDLARLPQCALPRSGAAMRSRGVGQWPAGPGWRPNVAWGGWVCAALQLHAISPACCIGGRSRGAAYVGALWAATAPVSAMLPGLLIVGRHAFEPRRCCWMRGCLCPAALQLDLHVRLPCS